MKFPNLDSSSSWFYRYGVYASLLGFAFSFLIFALDRFGVDSEKSAIIDVVLILTLFFVIAPWPIFRIWKYWFDAKVYKDKVVEYENVLPFFHSIVHDGRDAINLINTRLNFLATEGELINEEELATYMRNYCREVSNDLARCCAAALGGECFVSMRVIEKSEDGTIRARIFTRDRKFDRLVLNDKANEDRVSSPVWGILFGNSIISRPDGARIPGYRENNLQERLLSDGFEYLSISDNFSDFYNNVVAMPIQFNEKKAIDEMKRIGLTSSGADLHRSLDGLSHTVESTLR